MKNKWSDLLTLIELLAICATIWACVREVSRCQLAKAAIERGAIIRKP